MVKSSIEVQTNKQILEQCAAFLEVIDNSESWYDYCKENDIEKEDQLFDEIVYLMRHARKVVDLLTV